VWTSLYKHHASSTDCFTRLLQMTFSLLQYGCGHVNLIVKRLIDWLIDWHLLTKGEFNGNFDLMHCSARLLLQHNTTSHFPFSMNTYTLLYLRQGGYVFVSVCLLACLSVSAGLLKRLWINFNDFSIARQQTNARYWYSNSVRLSVCLSVRDTLVLYENGLTYRHSFFTIR